MKKSERERKVQEVAELLDLTDQLHKKPGQLSGGQRQRVAMGRAIVREPSVFLMDEPLSNLDAKLRVQMRADIAALQSRLGVTTVYVTHDQSEAMTLGHRVAVLKDARLQQCDTPRELYARPANTFVAGFIGSPSMNLCTVPLTNGSVSFGGVERSGARGSAGREHRARPASRGARARHRTALDAEVEVVEELGADAYVFCVAEINGTPTKLVARGEARRAPAPRRACQAASGSGGGAPLPSRHRREDQHVSKNEFIQPDDVARPSFPYSPVVVSGDLVVHRGPGGERRDGHGRLRRRSRRRRVRRSTTFARASQPPAAASRT